MRDASKPKICGKSAAITKICKLLRKLRSLLDIAINSAIAESQNPGGTGSQNSGHLIIPRISKSTAGGSSFSYLAPKLWNNLPNTVREADTLLSV